MKNKKLLLIIFCIIFGISLPVHSKTVRKPAKRVQVKTQTPMVQSGYTVPSAKSEAFKDVKSYLPAISYRSDLTDKDYAANMAYIKQQVNVSPTRLIFPYFIGNTLISYGIRHNDKPEKVYYYNSQGKLLRIEFDNNNPPIYPKRTITYNNKGNLHAVVLYISDKEQYNFDGQGNLVVHWIGERGFNRMGQPLKIRRSL